MRVPTIEKENGNALAKKGKYGDAIAHYNKAMLALKMIFESD